MADQRYCISATERDGKPGNRVAITGPMSRAAADAWEGSAADKRGYKDFRIARHPFTKKAGKVYGQ